MQDAFKRSLVLNCVIILTSFVVFSLAAYFLHGQIEVKGESILDMRKSLARYTFSAERFALLKNSALEVQDWEKKMELFLPVQDQLWNFPDFIRALAADNQVELNISFQPNTTTPPGPDTAGSVGFSMQANGQLHDLIEFMEEMEKKTLRFWVGLDNADIIRSGDRYVLQSQGKVFFR